MISCTSTWYVTGFFYSILECFGHAKTFEATVKFHDALQYPDDIKQFGMTNNTSAGPKERSNKDSKRAAKGTKTHHRQAFMQLMHEASVALN